MFGSSALEIAIGLTFLYLALSLVCSGLAEYWSALTRRRGSHLRDALAFFFNANDPNGKVFFDSFFNQGLIRGLDPKGWKKLARGAAKGGPSGAKPTYIGSSTFVDVVFDLLARGESLFAPPPAAPGGGAAPSAPATATTTGAAPAPAPATLRATAAEAFRAVAGAVAMLPDGVMKTGLGAEVEGARASVPSAEGAALPANFWDLVAAAFKSVRDAIDQMHSPDSARPILAVVDREQERLRALRDNDAALGRLRAEAATTFTALRGAIALVPDDAARASLSRVLADKESELKAAAGTIGSSDGTWAVIKGMLDALAGASAVLPEGTAKAGLASLIASEAARLRGVKEDLLTVHKVRAAVASLPASEFKAALKPLMDESGEDLDAIKDNLMGWYDEAMQRVAGGYKRSTHGLVFLLALFVACFSNADTVAVADRLAKEPALRAAVAERAVHQLKLANADDAAPKPDAPTRLDAFATAADAAATGAEKLNDPAAAVVAKVAGPADVKATVAAKAEALKQAAKGARSAADSAKPAGAPRAEPSHRAAAEAEKAVAAAQELADAATKAAPPPAAELANLAAAIAAARKAVDEAKKEEGATLPAPAAAKPGADPNDELTKLLGLPVGWQSGEFARVTDFSNLSDEGLHHPSVLKALGLLLTTLALTMGAPFWFDVLNGLVNVRSAGKKPESTMPDGK